MRNWCLAPKKVLLSIGCNDVRNSIAAGTYEANYASIVSQLVAAGIDVYHLTYFAEGAGAAAAAAEDSIKSKLSTGYPILSKISIVKVWNL